MKNKRNFRRLLMLALTLVLCLGCLTSGGFATGENTLDDFLNSRFNDLEIEIIEENYSRIELEEKFNRLSKDELEEFLAWVIEHEGYYHQIGAVGVRANGAMVEFTDAKPYIDGNNRTMIPLRAAVEALGAEVSWDQATNTASVSKNGITVKVTIGSPQLEVVKNGSSSYTTMDTVAVLNTQEGRTYVPIRYVAEALGAYVDYADAFRVVGIYSDVFTAEEIETLRAFPYSLPKGDTTYEDYIKLPNRTEEDRIFYYGHYRETFGNYANSHECMYFDIGDNGVSYNFNDQTGFIAPGSADKFMELLIKEAGAELCWNSENLVITLRADQSCIYRPDSRKHSHTTIRGILTVTLNTSDVNVELKNLDGIEARRHMWALIGDEKITKLPEKGVPTSYYVDIHMNSGSSAAICVNKLVVLGKVE